MRVLLLSCAPGIPLYGPSGASAHLRGVARALARRGHEVAVAVPRLEDRRGAVDDGLDLPVITCPPRRWGWLPRRHRERGERWDARRLLGRALNQFEPDLIWERHSLFADAGVRWARRHGVRHLLEVNAPLADERARYETLRDPTFARRMEAAVLGEADRVVAVSAALARWCVARRADPGRVHHVPNGVEDRRGDREAARRRLGLEGLVVGFVGTMKPWHGLDRLPELLEALPEATALVVGDGPTRLPDHPRLRSVGRAEPAEVPDLVAAMDVGLAPYRAGGPWWFCPLKVLQYRAQGVPVVAGDVGDCARLVDGGGEVVGADDVETWARAIRRQARAPRARWTRSWDEVVQEALSAWTHSG